MADRPSSPYRPGMGLEPPYLGDREEQLARFEQALAEPQIPHNVLVTGLRGVGKTVLLKRFSDAAETANWLVAEREWSQGDADPETFRQLILDDLARLAHKLSLAARMRAAGEGLARKIRGLLAGVSLSYQGMDVTLGASSQSAVRRRLDDELRDLFFDVGRLCVESDHPGIILRYDEFHVVEERHGASTLSGLLSAVAAAQQEALPVMLILCGLPPLIEHLVQAKSYTERMFTAERLSNLRPEAARSALVDPAEALQRHFEEAAVAAVLEDTQGYPSFLQLYGDRLWKGVAGETITRDGFDQLRPRILIDLDEMFFEGRYVRATPRERALLHAVASLGGESGTVKQIADAANLKNNELQPLVSSLVNKGLVYRPARGVVAFTAPMFGAFLRRVIPH